MSKDEDDVWDQKKYLLEDDREDEEAVVQSPLHDMSDENDVINMEAEQGEKKKPCLSTPMKYALSIFGGVGFGIALNILHASNGVVTLSTSPGNLFLRALQCAVIPMMFFNITSSVVDIFGSGSAGSLGGKAIYFYTLTTLLAVLEGILMANVFSFLFNSDEGESDDDDGVEVGLVCPENFGTMTMEQDGSVFCVHEDHLDSFNLSASNQVFYLQDKDDHLVNGVVLKTTLVQQILSTLFSLVPNNMTESFAIPNIISVIVIAFVLGAALVVAQRNASSPTRRGVNKIGSESVLAFTKEMANISNIIIGWIIDYAPYCIGFLIANSLAGAGNIIDLVRTVGIYVASALSGIVLHLTVVLPLVFFYETRGDNPYKWMWEVRNPLIVAFSTESSAATLPVSIQTALDSGKVDEKVANTILPMGATINMDGSALGYPCAVAFLAHTAKLEDKLSFIVWINIALGSTLGSAGAAPVPNAGVIMLITVWETALPGYAVPDAIAYVQAIGFLVERFQTACNVCSDMFIIRMIQAGIERERKRQELEDSRY